MNGYNFFEPYIVPPQKTNVERLIWIVFAIIFLFGLLFVFIFMSGKINDEYRQVEDYQEILTSDKIKNDLIELQNTENNMHSLLDAYTKLKLSEGLHNGLNVYEKDLYREVITKVPDNVFVENIIYQARSLTIDGNGESIEAIALFSNQLSQMNRVESVVMGTLTQQTAGYSYDLVVNLNEEVADETQ